MRLCISISILVLRNHASPILHSVFFFMVKVNNTFIIFYFNIIVHHHYYLINILMMMRATTSTFFSSLSFLIFFNFIIHSSHYKTINASSIHRNSSPQQKNKKCVQAGSIKACKLPNAHLPHPLDPQTFEQGESNSSSETSSTAPPPLTPFYRINTKTAITKQNSYAGFDATIIGQTTMAQRRAIDRCMTTADEWWPSTIRVDVLVNFSSVGGPRVLGSARPTSNWEIDGVIYPVALAEALTNTTLNSSPTSSSTSSLSDQYDIYMTLNSGARWFATTIDEEEEPEPMTYDLVTVCLHELIHGLFMSGGNLVVTRQQTNLYLATLFNPKFVGRFDSFMSDKNGCSIIKGYGNNSITLGASLTGNNLWFANMQGDIIARLHAPKPYVAGSSLYHLSEVTYGAGLNGNNDLMTPIIGTSYSQHEIGDVTRLMLGVIFDTKQSHAKICENMGPPTEDDSIIEGGGSNSGNGDNGGDGDDGNTNPDPEEQKQTGFYITLGTVQISGWIIVGAAVGLVATIFTTVFVIRAIIVSSAKKRIPPRLVSRPDRIEITTNGNTTGIV